MGESVRCWCCKTHTSLVLDGDEFICRWCRDTIHDPAIHRWTATQDAYLPSSERQDFSDR